MNISVIIPCYNEEKAIAEVIKSIPKNNIKEIIVVDNNSTDKSAEVAKTQEQKLFLNKNKDMEPRLKEALKKQAEILL